MQSLRPDAKYADVAAGAVSVAPHDVVIGADDPVDAATFAIPSHTCWGSAAAA